jgi:hypothetical protein
VIELYGDISGKPQDIAMVAAAYFGTEAEWAAVDRAWAEALREAGVGYFHATDFFGCHREFADWTPNSKRHRAMAERFTAIAERHGLDGYAFGVEVTAFQDVVQPLMTKLPRKLRVQAARTFCVQGVLSRVANSLLKNPLPRYERIAITFEAEKGIGEAVDFFWHCKRKREDWTRGMLDFTTANKDSRPVQVADLLAHQPGSMSPPHCGTRGLNRASSFVA